MKVLEVASFGDPDVLRLAERPDPLPGPGELLVAVGAATVNPSDIAARRGETHRRIPDMPMPFVPGWDVAGVVSAVGAGVEGFAVGKRVAALIPWVPIRARVGGYAEFAVVQADWAAVLPDGVVPTVAATVPLSGLTASQGLDILDLSSHASLLVTGASGAVGGVAAPLARAAWIEVSVQVGSGDEAWGAALGAVHVVDRTVDLAALGPFDAVFDAAPIGSAALVAVRPGGVAVFTRPPQEAPDGYRCATVFVQPDSRALTRLLADLVAGTLRTRVHEVLPLGDGALAHQCVERRGLRGKVVLVP